jgi:hypothetical protein
MISVEAPDSFYVKDWIRYKDQTLGDSSFTNSW